MVVNLKQLLALFIGGLMVVVTLVASSAYINSTIKAVTTKMSYQHNQGGVISLLAAQFGRGGAIAEKSIMATLAT